MQACPAVIGIGVQVIETFQVFRIDDGGPGSPFHQLPQWTGRASHSQPVFFAVLVIHLELSKRNPGFETELGKGKGSSFHWTLVLG